MKQLGIIFLTLAITISCQNKTDTGGFTIQGTAKNVPDGTHILLYFFPNTHKVVDSTVVMGEKFQFKGNLDRPTLAHVRMPNSRDDKTFWLENAEILVVGEKGRFMDAEITGSKTQDESTLLLARKDSLFNEMEKLEAMVTDSNRDSLFTIYEQMQNVEVGINQKFIAEYPESYESLTRLNWSKERLGGHKTEQLFSSLGTELQASEEGKAIQEFIVKNQTLAIGDNYVDFEQSDPDGQMVRLSDVKGKYTLLEFWASWCGPCRSFNPELVELHEQYKDQGFEILGISLDSDEGRWKEAIEKDGLTWTNVSDLKGANNEAAMIYGVRDIPDNFLIDENGKIVARFIRGDALKNKLKEVFEIK